MNAKIRRFTWILSGALVVGAGAMGAVACGTDNGTTPLPGDVDSGTSKTDSGGGPGTDGGPGVDSGGNPGTDAGSDAAVTGCDKIPTLHAAGVGPFCPFQADPGDAAPAFGDCDAGETCCQYQGTPPTPASTCAANAAACGAAASGFVLIDWDCDTKAHCGGTNACCMFGKNEIEGGTTKLAVDSNCSTGQLLRATNVGGTKCAVGNSCANGEVKLCADDSDCTAPDTCRAFPTNSKQLGACFH